MGKTCRTKRKWYDPVLKNFQKKVLQLNKSLPMIISKARPFLTLKYLPIYLLSFGLGFYLWGPNHGFQKLMLLRTYQAQKDENPSSIETLKREIDRLKKELEARKTIQPREIFDAGLFSRPALGQVIQGFEWMMVKNSWRLHSGVDIGLPPGSNVIAAAAGTVSEVKKTEDGSFIVSIEHGNSWKSVYANLANPRVQKGQDVIKGVIVGVCGSLSCNMKDPGFHFGIYHDGQPVNPITIIDGLSK